MLNDPGRDEDFRRLEYWKSPLLDFRAVIPQPGQERRFKSNSLSGNERNRLIMRGKGGFVDRSLVSGVDCKEDARSYSLLDFDRDGWVDIALPSINGQRFRLFRNRFGDLGSRGRAIEIELSGGNHSAAGSMSHSNRDAVGAILTVLTDKTERVYRKSIGEGMAAQNSGRIRVTLAEQEQLKALSVRWPSGKVSELDAMPEQSLFLIQE